jgi:S1-C subfamily serine protease
MGIWVTDRERRRRAAFYIILAAIVSSGLTGAVVCYLEMGYIESVVSDLRINQTRIIANITQEELVTRIVENVRSSVVHITSTRIAQGFFGAIPLEGTGTGFIISPDGYIATNNHVVSGATDVKAVLHDGNEYEAKVIGTDPMTDIAIIKIEAADLTPVVLGDSDRLSPGQYVIAIGNPYRLDNTVTFGVVSALNRTITTEEGYKIEGVIQTDAAINPGNSGGPLINMQGEVIGVNTAILSTTGGSQGIGFAVPINMLSSVSHELIEEGKVTRAWLGITGTDMNEDLAKAFNVSVNYGALVVTVVSGGPADKAGLRETVHKDGVITQLGDIIVEMAGFKVENMNDLVKRIQKLETGDKVLIRFVRDGGWKQLAIALGERPENL